MKRNGAKQNLSELGLVSVAVLGRCRSRRRRGISPGTGKRQRRSSARRSIVRNLPLRRRRKRQRRNPEGSEFGATEPRAGDVTGGDWPWREAVEARSSSRVEAGSPSRQEKCLHSEERERERASSNFGVREKREQ